MPAWVITPTVPGKDSPPHVTLLGTFPFWPSFGRPWDRAATGQATRRPLRKDSLTGCQCGPGSSSDLGSALPPPPSHLSSDRLLQRKAFWEQAAAALFPWAFTPVPTSPKHLVVYSVCPSSIVVSKVFSSFGGRHSAHQQGQRFPNWGP